MKNKICILSFLIIELCVQRESNLYLEMFRRYMAIKLKPVHIFSEKY